jgi:hypothetical protein
MKSFITVVALTLSVVSISAQGLIAVQGGGAPSFYTQLSDAVTNAQAGDTIYLPGGSFGDITLSKQLTIIGVGHHPDSTVATGRTVLSSLYITIGADNSFIIGVFVDGTISSDGNASGIRISRCYLNQGIVFYGGQCSNWIISENWIGTYSTFFFGTMFSYSLLSSGSSSDFLVTNNIFANAINGISFSEISNNIFLDGSISGSYLVLRNNVVHNGVDLANSMSHSQFYNNLNSGVNGGPTGSGNTGAGNYLDNVELQGVFINYASGNTFYQNDFHVVNPAYLGQDGTPVGIYGGVFPWKDGSLPFTPHISSKAINATTNPDGSLHINITVKAQDN